MVDVPIPEHWTCHRRASQATIVPFILATLCLIFGSPMSSKAKTAAPELNFEKAMDRLEAIVEQMETGKLPLEDLIVRYEEGMNLVKVCQERLTSAEQKIEIIARNNASKPVVKNFEPAAESANDDKFATANPSGGGADEKELKNDEVRLF
jgi:exodeoxyribonuclease VII small subunit